MTGVSAARTGQSLEANAWMVLRMPIPSPINGMVGVKNSQLLRNQMSRATFEALAN